MKRASGPFTLEVPEQGAVRGHVRMSSSSAAPDDIAALGMCANVLSSILFERMQAQGTNIIMHLGQGAEVEVLARTEGDGLDFRWAPKQVDPGRFEEIQGRIQNKAFFIGKDQAGPSAREPPAQNAAALPEHHADEGDEDELVKHLYRIP